MVKHAGKLRRMSILLALLMLLVPTPHPRSLMPTCLPTTPAQYQAIIAAQPASGDGMMSARLGPCRAVLLTGDAIPVDGGTWPHTTLTTLNGAAGKMTEPGYPGVSPYQFVPDQPDGTYSWFGPAFVAGVRLYSLAPHLAPMPQWPYFESRGVDWVEVDVATTPRFVARRPTPTPPPGVVWGSAVWYDVSARVVYVFGRSANPTDGWTGHDVYLARTPLAGVASGVSWSYWAGGTSWQLNPLQARPFLSAPRDGGVDTAFSAWRDSAGWHITSRLGGRWGAPVSEAARWTRLELDWTRQRVAGLPSDAYLVVEHWDLPRLANGRTLLTYNQDGKPATFTSTAA